MWTITTSSTSPAILPTPYTFAFQDGLKITANLAENYIEISGIRITTEMLRRVIDAAKKEEIEEGQDW